MEIKLEYNLNGKPVTKELTLPSVPRRGEFILYSAPEDEEPIYLEVVTVLHKPEKTVLACVVKEEEKAA